MLTQQCRTTFRSSQFTSVSENGKLKVFRREDVNDLSDSRKTDDWYGWSTVTLLYNYDPKNSVV